MDAEMHLGPAPMPGSHQINSAHGQDGNLNAPIPPAPEPERKGGEQLMRLLVTRELRGGRFDERARVAHGLRQVMFGRLTERGVTLQPDQTEAVILMCSSLAQIVNGDPNHATFWRDVAVASELVARRLEGNPT